MVCQARECCGAETGWLGQPRPFSRHGSSAMCGSFQVWCGGRRFPPVHTSQAVAGLATRLEGARQPIIMPQPQHHRPLALGEVNIANHAPRCVWVPCHVALLRSRPPPSFPPPLCPPYGRPPFLPPLPASPGAGSSLPSLSKTWALPFRPQFLITDGSCRPLFWSPLLATPRSRKPKQIESHTPGTHHRPLDTPTPRSIVAAASVRTWLRLRLPGRPAVAPRPAAPPNTTRPSSGRWGFVVAPALVHRASVLGHYSSKISGIDITFAFDENHPLATPSPK